MMKLIGLLLAIMTVAVAVADVAAATGVISRVEVRAAPVSIRAGMRVPVAIRFAMAPGWYTYAEDPGDFGLPPEITLTAPPQGVALDKWQFPPAKRFTDAAGTTFGYENEVVLLGGVQLPSSLPDDEPLELELRVVWMVCKEACVPLADTVVLVLPAQPSQSAEAFAQWERFLAAGGWSACM